MSDLIKRSDVIERLGAYLMADAQIEWGGTASEDIEDWKELASDILKGAPTIDAVSVVRCKECKKAHLTYDGDCKYCDMWKDDDDNFITVYHDGNFYCGYGERKESE